MQRLHVTPHVLEAETECQVQHGPRSRAAKASSVGARAQQHKPSLQLDWRGMWGWMIGAVWGAQSIYFEDKMQNMIRRLEMPKYANGRKRYQNIYLKTSKNHKKRAVRV